MKTLEQITIDKQALILEQSIKTGAIKTVSQLLKRTNKANLPYTAYISLHQKLVALHASTVPMFLRKQAF